MKFEISHKTKVPSSFRVQSIISSFDIQGDVIEKKISGEIDLDSKPWNIGLIVGSSGSGKSSIARECFKAEIISGFDWTSESILDDMPKGLKIERIVEIMSSVGFSSPPSWIKPFHVLSEGEKMRVTLARAILEARELFVFDEFTSVVDRQVAKIGSLAIQKAVRKSKSKFIALSCHRDVIEWLQPDWIFDTDEQRFFFANQIDQKLASRFFPALETSGDCLKIITI
jgi:ABC-type ATPase with predicted acetyltransferase domain